MSKVQGKGRVSKTAKRVAIYLRVSTAEQTTANQCRELQAGRQAPRLVRGQGFRG